MQKMINFDAVIKKKQKKIIQMGHKSLIIHTEYYWLEGPDQEKQIHYLI